MKKALLNSLKFAAFLILGLVLLYLAFRNVSIVELRSHLGNANYRWLALSVAASVAAFASRARRWQIIIGTLGFTPPLKNVYHALMSGYLANMALPRMGEVTRCALLGRKEKIPFDRLVGTVILERVVDVASLLIIMGIMLVTSFDTLGSFLRDNIILALSEKTASVLGSTLTARIVTVTLAFTLLLMTFIFRKRIFGKRLYPRVRGFISGMYQGFRSIRSLERKWEFIIHSVFIWFAYAVMTWAVVFVLPATSHLGFGDALFLLVIGGFGMAAPVQSGLGAFHVIISMGLNLVYGISRTDGLAYALVSHTSQMILIALLGSVSMLLIMRHRNNNSVKP